MIANFGDRTKSSASMRARSLALKGGTDMFRQMVTRMGLPAIAGLGLLLVGGPAKADPQGWPVAGNWDSYGSSSPSSIGRYSPYYYSQSSIPQPGAYYGFATTGGYYGASTTGDYYGSSDTEGYYGTPITESPAKRPVRVNLRVPSDAKIWFDGSQTKQIGTTRSFESPPLAVGPEYAYQVRIQWKRDGKEATQTRQINVHAGDVVNLTLGSPSGSALAR
jgi:uncharacterized protein (TIGR03000 family)